MNEPVIEADNGQRQPGLAPAPLLGVLGLNAMGRYLTSRKAEEMLKHDDRQITGFVMTDKFGNIGIVDKSAVRWLKKSEMWWLMHESNELPPSTPNVES